MTTIPAVARVKRWRKIHSRANLPQLGQEMGEMLTFLEAVLRTNKRLAAIHEEYDELVSALITLHTTEELYKADGSTEPYGNYQVASERVTRLAKRLAERQR